MKVRRPEVCQPPKRHVGRGVGVSIDRMPRHRTPSDRGPLRHPAAALLAVAAGAATTAVAAVPSRATATAADKPAYHRTTVARPAAARDTARDADHDAARNAARDAGRAAARDAARKAARDANRTAARKAARAATPSAAEGVPDLEPWRVNSDRPHAQNSKKTALFETFYPGGRIKLRRGGPDHPPPLAPGLHLRDDKPIAVAMHQNGPAANRIDLVFVGDGYTKDEQATFNASAERTWNALMTYEPYKTYQNFFDGWRVNLVSPVSGISNDPNQNTPRATPLGMHFWCHDVDRLLCVDTTAASA